MGAHMKHQWAFRIVLFVLVAVRAGGQSPAPAASPVSLFGEHTVAAVRVDVSRLDAEAIVDTLVRLAPAAQRAEIQQQAAEIPTTIESFKDRWRKSGLGEVFFAFDLDDLGDETPLFAVVAGDALLSPDARAVVSRLLPPPDFDLEGATGTGVGGVSVLAGERTLRRLRDPEWRADEDWAGAFAAAPPALVQVVLKPYDGWERVVEELLPVLPSFLGGGPSTAISRGLNVFWLAADAPPRLSLAAGIRSESRAHAEALQQVLRTALKHLAAQDNIRELLPGVDALVTALTPTVGDDGLRLSLDTAQIEEHLSAPLAAMLTQGRTDAQRAQAMVGLRNIGVGCILYTADHNGQWPEHLGQILPLVDAESLVGPEKRDAIPGDLASWPEERQRAWLDEHSAVVYVRPRAPTNQLAEEAYFVVLAYTAPGHAPFEDGVGVVFADGHVELLASREELAARLGPRTGIAK